MYKSRDWKITKLKPIKMLKTKTLMVLIVLIYIFFGCTNSIIREGDIEPISDLIKYNPDVQNILTTHCTNCHGGNNPQAGVNLETYENTRFYSENGDLLEKIYDLVNPMPPSGLLPTSEIAIIEKWAQDGFLEN